MILWPCAACGFTGYCAHREHELVVWAVAHAGDVEVVPDPLPEQPVRRVPPVRAIPRKPAARETRASRPGAFQKPLRAHGAAR